MKVRPVVPRQTILNILNERLREAEDYKAEDEASLKSQETKLIRDVSREADLNRLIASADEAIRDVKLTIRVIEAHEGPMIAMELDI